MELKCYRKELVVFGSLLDDVRHETKKNYSRRLSMAKSYSLLLNQQQHGI